MGAGGSVNCTLASFPAGASATFTLVVDTTGVSNGSFLTNIAAVSSAADVNDENNVAAASTAVGTFADLSVLKNGPASILDTGGPITYDIFLSNMGPDAAQSVSLSDTLPPTTTFISFSQTSGPAFSCTTPAPGAGGTVTCTIATLAAGATASFTLVVNAPAAPSGGAISNTASVSTTSADPDNGNDSSSAVTTYELPSAELSVIKTGPATAIAGSNITYTIALSNNGPQDAQSVVLTDNLPPFSTFVSLTSPGGFSCTTDCASCGPLLLSAIV